MATGTIYCLYIAPDEDENDLSTGRIIFAEVAPKSAEIHFILQGYKYVVNMKKISGTKAGYEGYWTCDQESDKIHGRFHSEPSGHTFIGEYIEEGYKYKILCEIIV